MDAVTAGRLLDDSGREALDLAAAETDPASFGAATRMRRRFDPDLAAAALTQVALRRRARTKLPALADRLWLTPDGLQQASRPAVSAARARRLLAAGVRHVVDLGCGIGADALAFAAAGLAVTAVEADPVTALLARANLADETTLAGWAERSGLPGPTRGAEPTVVAGRAEEVAADLLTDPATAVFCDPARRDERGRVWRVEQFSPPWEFVTGLLDGRRVGCVKLGPALPHALIPDGVEAEWVSHDGDVVECALWAGPTAEPGARVATLLPSADRLRRVGPAPTARTGPIGRFLHEPDGAAIRAGLVTSVARSTGTVLVDPQIAYLTGDDAVASPWLTSFEVIEVLPYTEKVLRRWLTEHRIGRLEIKKRGVDVDPAALRRRLKPAGVGEATLLVTRTPAGTRAVMARRAAP